MAVKINFDSTHNVEVPTMVLAKRSGDKLGALSAKNIVYKSTLTTGSEISFRIYKFEDNKRNDIWDEVEDFKLLYCPEWNEWFELTVEVEESDETIKNVQGKSLGVSELSQIMLYGIQINTDDDIESDSFSQYGKTILYSTNKEISMLDRLLKDKASHYQIGHIDTTLITETERRLVQFEFDNKSLYDALQEIAEELNAILYIDTSTVTTSTDRLGEITRTINMYDLETNCLSCLYRGDFHDTCPKCGSTGDYIKEGLSEWNGHGEDTTVFVSVDNLTDEINYSTDSDSVKNCFKLEAGDETMTDIIRSCNANGSSYIWYISDDMKEDMSEDLVSTLDAYDELYDEYQNTHQYAFSVSDYNDLITKYQELDSTLTTITSPIVGYPSLMTDYFNALDFSMYLTHRLMPTVAQESTTAANELTKAITYLTNNGLALHNYSQYTSDSTIESSLKSVIGAIVSSNYKVSVSTQSSTFNSSTVTGTWTGSITLERYYEDESDPTATETGFTVNLNGNAALYYKQLINKKIDQLKTDETYGVSNLLSLDTSLTDFATALTYYNLKSLQEFRTICDAVLNVLIEQGVADQSQWNEITGTANLYNNMYLPYLAKSSAIDSELSLRESEIAKVTALQDAMDAERLDTMETLDFPNYLKTEGGQNVWIEFCSFRREDTYSNSNYISDGLDNAELFNQALRFLEIARKEIFKSATLQHSISAKLYNLLVMKEFEPLVDHFAIGNWIHLRVDEKYYKLRLVDYEIDYDNLEDISVTFSDVTTTADGYTDLESVINSAKSMATSYSTVQRQADKGETGNQLINRWFDDGLSMSAIKLKSDSIDQAQSWDGNGMLFKRMIPETGEYEATQMKIINSTIAITTDNWSTVRTAIGKFNYRDMTNNGAWKEGYGINGETIVGRLILGQELGIYNSGGSLSFDQNGLTITGNNNQVIIQPNNTSQPNASIFSINKMSSGAVGDNIFKLNTNGDLEINGKITSTSGLIGGWSINQYDLLAQFSTQETIYTPVTKTRQVPSLDANGNPIYQLVDVTDGQGNPVYETDADGNIIYTDSDTQATDGDGNLVWETDDDGNLVTDVNGNYIPVYVQIPVVKQEYQMVYTTETYTEIVESISTTYYDNYTLLKSQGDVALSVGATSPSDSSTGKIKLYNNGVLQDSKTIIDNGQGEPQLLFKRTINSGTAESKIFFENLTPGSPTSNRNNNIIAFGFKGETESNYIYSAFINKYGFYPYATNTYGLGTSSYRWSNLYVGGINATGTVSIGNTLQMTDTRGKRKNVLQLYPYYSGTDYSNSNVLIQGDGGMFIGSGESPSAIYNAYKKNYGNSEDMFLSSDQNVWIHTNCQNIGNRVGFCFDKSSNFYTIYDNKGYLGKSGRRWKAIYAKSATINTSDERYKTDISDIEHCKELIMNVRPIQYRFTYSDSDRLHYGFSSQKVKAAMELSGISDCGIFCLDVTEKGEELGFTRNNAPEKYLLYGLRYEEFIAPTIAVVQDHENTINALQEQVQEMRALLNQSGIQ